MMVSSRFLWLALLVAPAAAQADALTDLRTTLAGLRGSTPISASVALEQTSKRGDADAPKVASGKAALVARLGGDGLQLDYAAATLARIDAEADARNANPEATTPIGDLLREAGPTRIAALLSYANTLLRKLEQASVKEDRADSVDGKALRLLVLDVPPSLAARERESMKDFTSTLRVWLDDAGTPVAIEQQQDFSGRRMLISFTGNNRETATLRRVGDRLVATRQMRQQGFAGFGESSDTTTTASVTLP